MSTYTKRFLLGSNFTGDISATVPTGKTWIVTDVSALGNPGTQTWLMRVNGVAVVGVQISGSAWSAGQWHGKLVAYAGDVLSVNVSLASNVMVVGYEFDA